MMMNSYKYYQAEYRASGKKQEKTTNDRNLALFFII